MRNTITLILALTLFAGCSTRDDAPVPVDGALPPADSGAGLDGGSTDAGTDADAAVTPDSGTPPGNSTPTGGSGGGVGMVSGNYEGRDYLLYVPASYQDETPAPVVVALFGFGDTHAGYYSTLSAGGWTAAADAAGFLLLVPDAMNTRPSFLHLDSGGGFLPDMTRAEVQGVLDTVYYGVGATHNVETTELYMTGFSEGGVVTEVTGVWFADEFRALAVYGAAVSAKAESLATLTRQIPVYMISGTGDNAYTTGAAPGSLAEWEAAGHPNNHAWVEGAGHSMSTLQALGPPFADVFTWMSEVEAGPVTSAYAP